MFTNIYPGILHLIGVLVMLQSVLYTSLEDELVSSGPMMIMNLHFYVNHWEKGVFFTYQYV